MSVGRPQDAKDHTENAGRMTEETDALETLRGELARLRAEVEALNKAGGLAPSAVVVADELLLGADQGFYPVERTEDGVAFSWTGPSPDFRLTVAVDRFAGANLKLEGISFIDFERQKDVRLQADGQDVPLAVTRGGIGVVITGMLPARTEADPTALTFTLPVTLSPNTADTRQLGLAFFKLTVTARAPV